MLTRKSKSESPRRAILQPPSAESLGLEGLTPDAEEESGISLEELGQTYAALIAKGADPYPDEQAEASSPSTALEEAGADSEPTLRRVVDGDDDRACDITPRSILEAILFVGHPLNEPLSSQQLAGLMRGVTSSEIDDLVGELNEGYAEEGAPYQIQSHGAGYLLALREDFASLQDRFYGRIKEVRLTQSAIDVLAIVAYNQPITLQEIDRIRGRSSGGAISQLVRRDILAYEKSSQPGCKPTYRTTERFLDLYGLESLEDLPQVER